MKHQSSGKVSRLNTGKSYCPAASTTPCAKAEPRMAWGCSPSSGTTSTSHTSRTSDNACTSSCCNSRRQSHAPYIVLLLPTPPLTRNNRLHDICQRARSAHVFILVQLYAAPARSGRTQRYASTTGSRISIAGSRGTGTRRRQGCGLACPEISTRRLGARHATRRPAATLLHATTGSALPRPPAVMAPAATPCCTR